MKGAGFSSKPTLYSTKYESEEKARTKSRQDKNMQIQ